jgi:hypothetical protein
LTFTHEESRLEAVTMPFAVIFGILSCLFILPALFILKLLRDAVGYGGMK